MREVSERSREVVQKMLGRSGEMDLWLVWTPTPGMVYYLPDDAPDWTEMTEAEASSEKMVHLQLSFSFLSSALGKSVATKVATETTIN